MMLCDTIQELCYTDEYDLGFQDLNVYSGIMCQWNNKFVAEVSHSGAPFH